MNLQKKGKIIAAFVPSDVTKLSIEAKFLSALPKLRREVARVQKIYEETIPLPVCVLLD